jgi:exopolysaccharide biosynthesis polyprenyl glycosylphosphotransferase
MAIMRMHVVERQGGWSGSMSGESGEAQRKAGMRSRLGRAPVSGVSLGLGGLGIRRRSTSQQITEARGPAASLRRDALFRRMLLTADIVAIAGTFLLMTLLSPRPLQLTWLSLVGLPLLLIGAKLFGLYDRDETLLRKTTLDEVPKLFHLATLCALAAWLGSELIVEGGYLRRPEALILWLALLAGLVLARASARAIALYLSPVERCLFVGGEDSARTIRSKLTDHRGIKASMVARLDLEQAAPWSADALSAERLEEIRDLAQELDVHRAIVAPGNAEGGEILNLVRTLKAVGVRVSVLPRLLEVVGSSVEFDDLHGVTVMGVRRFELTRSSAMVKRGFDLLGATIGLLAVSPLMIVAAVAIKLDSPGPIFFRQLRVGRHGQRFHILKFRTMVENAEALKDSLRDRNEAQDGLFKIADDPRVTRVGRILRKSALDEMPQLLNIIKGEMSLVGPRPLIVEEDMRVLGWHRRRLELTPGMTGHWQILGPARVPLSEMAAIDYLYVANWSLWKDVKILLRTVPHVIGRRGL